MSEISLIPETLTMTSREIAELTGKRHDNVMADIRQMLSDLELHAPDFSGAYKTDRGNEYEFFTLPKRETYILITGYSVTMRAKIIDRWQELEKQVRDLQEQLTMSPQVLKDLIEGAAEKAVENYKQLDHINFNMLKQDVAILDILASKRGHGPAGIKKLTAELLKKYGRPDLLNMLDAIGEVPDYDQHQSWEAVEELAQSYLKSMLDVRKKLGKKPLPEPTPEQLEAASLNWRIQYMPYSLVTSPTWLHHLEPAHTEQCSAAKAFAKSYVSSTLNRKTGKTTTTWHGSANLNQLLLGSGH